METNKKSNKLIEGITLLVLGAVMLLILLGVFGTSGKVVSNFLVGAFGYAVYGYAVAAIVAGILLICNFKFYKRPAVIIGALLVFISFISIFHALASQSGSIAGYGSYINSCYTNRNTCGGALGAIFLYPLIKLNYIFTIVVFSIVAVAGVLFGMLAEFKKSRGISTTRIGSKPKTSPKIQISERTAVGDLTDFSRITEDTRGSGQSAIGGNYDYHHGDTSQTFNVSTLEEAFVERDKAKAVEELFPSKPEPKANLRVSDTASAIDILFNPANAYSGDIVGEKEEREYTLDEAKRVLYESEPVKPASVAKPSKPKVELSQADIDNYTIDGRTRIMKENLLSRGEIILVNPSTPIVSTTEQPTSGRVVNSFAEDTSVSTTSGDVASRNDVITNNVTDSSSSASTMKSNYGGTPTAVSPIYGGKTSSISSVSATTIEGQASATTPMDKYSYLDDNVEDMSAVNPEPLESFQDIIRKNPKVGETTKPIITPEVAVYKEQLERKRRERSDKGGEHVSSKREVEERDEDVFGQMGGGINLNIKPTMPTIDKLSSTDLGSQAKPSASAANIKQSPDLGSQAKPSANAVTIKPQTPSSPYKAPPINLMRSYENKKSNEAEDFEDKIAMLESTLKSFHIPARVNNIIRGPAFSRLELVLPPGVPVNKVNQRAKDIAMCLEAQSLRLQIPIPGKNAFGVELPNKEASTIGLKEIINSPEFNGSNAQVICALGKDVDGHNHVLDLATMPHLLVAGSTGSGKSVCLNSMLISILYRHTPEEVRIALVDPKQVEFSAFNGLPHLLVPQSIIDKEHAINLLDYLISEMETRYTMINMAGCKKITEYNRYAAENGKEKMYYILAVLDEVGDLMEQCKKDIEGRISRLAAKARAAGIILVIATQRPSVNVITGVIKANLPSRIAFAVSQFEDSKTILGQGGAESLLGKGDMLLMHNGAGARLQRIQGAFIDTDEVNAICEYVKANNTAHYDTDISEMVFRTKKPIDERMTDALGNTSGDPDIDSTFVKALLSCIEEQYASIGLIQRKYRLGYNRAAIYFYKMEEMGYISREVVQNRRQVILTREEFDIIYGDFQLV